MSNSISDSLWPEWRNYILPRAISAEDQQRFHDKIENGTPLTETDFCTVVFQQEFAGIVTFALQALGYITKEQNPSNMSDKEKSDLLNNIDYLMSRAWSFEKEALLNKLNRGEITKPEYNKQILAIKQKFSNLESAAGDLLYTTCVAFGLILDNVKSLSYEQTQTAAYNLFDSIGLVSQINKNFYQFKNMVPRNIGGKKTTSKRQKAIAIVEEIIKNHNIKRPVKNKNPIEEIVSTIKAHYKTKTGESYPNVDKTLENLVYEYFSRPGN